ncbi:CHAT domain-containing protein [Roseisolibacter agri]|uniref:CHAT domain-containing protein n=1 Tax=Roseisolibacter agri TaxID=2014610 RepID=A0AA37Q5A8_9BACT|nr:CHAT domain-containing tetratricopeptide repeat protein [Roseisolibacter agri]GLC24907.1 hypothetical protein rosag_14200 [Roseisolibacter agri]
MRWHVLVRAAVVLCLAAPLVSQAQPPSTALADSARRLDSLATAIFSQGTPERRQRGARMLAEAADLFGRSGDRRRQGATLLRLARLHDHGDTSRVHLHASLVVAREAGDRDTESQVLLELAYRQMRLGQADSALLLLQSAVQLTRTLGVEHDPTHGLAIYWLAHVSWRLGQLDSAEAYYWEAVRGARTVGDHVADGRAIGDLGNIHAHRARFDSALVYFHAARESFRAAGERAMEATWLNNIGTTHLALGRADSALWYYSTALPIAREHGHRPLEGALLSGLGDVHEQVGRKDSAAANFRRAAEIAHVVGVRGDEGQALTSLGRVQRDLGQPDSALQTLRRALDLLRAAGYRMYEADALDVLAGTHDVMARADSADAAYREGLRVARAGRYALQEETLLRHLGDHYRGVAGRSDLARAVAYFDSAAAVRSFITATAGSDSRRVSFAETGVELYDHWALAWLARAPEVGEEQSVLAALAVTERGRAQALLELMRRGVGGDSTSMARVRTLTRRDGVDAVAEGRALVAAIRTSGAPVLTYLATADTLLAWLVLPSGEVAMHRQALARDSVARLVADFRAGIGADEVATRARSILDASDAPTHATAAPTLARRGRTTRASVRALADVLLPPTIARKLPASGPLVVIPQGQVALTPFVALPSVAARGIGEPLGARHAIRYAPSIETMRATDAAPTTRTSVALVVGNPVMPSVRLPSGRTARLPALPGAAREGQWIARALGVAPLTGAAATERAVLARLGDAGVVHLATHGFAYSSDARALDSFVALAADSADTRANNGLLTVGEILDAGPRLVADLVVLSACQTALGNLKQAEGTVGLQRAFLAKGARSVLVSLWSVSDAATELLMRRFYTHWLRDADRPGKAEALRRAQRDVRATPRFAEPRYWAAFQLVGAQ